MLIRGAELQSGRIADVRVEHDRIAAIGALEPAPGEQIVEAHGHLLLPGLHDHHIHVAATAAAFASVQCGPPQVTDLDGLRLALAMPGKAWLRGIGYHESVAGMLDRATLDAIRPDRPIRIQHRSGRMWFLNSAAIELLPLDNAPSGLNRATGQLFEGDAWLKLALAGTPPDFTAIGRRLAARGVTGLTEISPANDGVIARHFLSEQARGALPQRVLLAGSLALRSDDVGGGIALGPAKLHLHEADLPDFDASLAFITTAHDKGRPVAVHCASEVELVFALAALAEAGAEPGDRIEHASVTPNTALDEIARLGLAVVSQPHFIAERGDAYRADVEPASQPLLYRLRGFLDAAVPLAAGSDAPYGGTDPWASMAAAVSRRTPSGATIGPEEALDADQALALYLRDPTELGRTRVVEPGAPADLCLIDRCWAEARDNLAAVDVRSTWVDGRLIHDLVDQAPIERRARTDATA